jgi:hypothetical protein
MAVKKDKKPILAKFTQGVSVGSAEKSSFTDWTLIYYTRDSLSGGFVKEVYGIDDNFDLIIILDSNDITKQISRNTVFLINEYPTTLNKEGNYIVKKILKHDNGEIMVGLEKRKSTQHKNLYYAVSGEIYSVQLNFDNETMKAYTNKYEVVPFETGSVLWVYEPNDIDDSENRIIVTSVTEVGIIDNYKIFKEYSFGEYNE